MTSGIFFKQSFGLARWLLLSVLICFCANPLGENNSIDSSFSPGGDATAPSAPTIISLSGAATFTKSPSMNWVASTDNKQLSGYEIGVGTDTASDDVMSFTSIGNVTSFQVTGINPQLTLTTNYYLLLRAIDTSGNKSDIVASSAWSPGLTLESGAYLLPESPTYYVDCNTYLSSQYYNNEGNGNYWLDVDGPGGIPAFIATCDMDSNGGGWTLILNYVHKGGTNPALSVKTLDLPVLSSDTLGDDESATPSSWGHASNNFLVNMSFSQMIFNCRTSGHARVMNFSTSLVGIITYMKTGTGSFAGVEASFTPLSGHTAGLPASRDNQFTNQGDSALTAFPMIDSGVAHWGVRASGGRWECDDFPGGSGNDTIHRVWVR